MRIILTIIVFFTLIEAKGKVERVQGSATVTYHKTVSPLKGGETVYDTALLKTQSHSRIKLRLEDNTLIQIGSNSRFIVESSDYTPKKKSILLTLKEGAFRFITGKISQFAPKRFKVKTTTATLGIRGTDVALFQQDQQFGALNLGIGKGFYLSAFDSETNLTKQGEGVFMHTGGLVPEADFWNYQDSHTLLQKITMHDEVFDDTIDFTHQSNLRGYIKLSYNERNSDAYHFDTVVNLSYQSPVWNKLYLHTAIDILKNIKDNVFTISDSYSVSVAALNYRDSFIGGSIGRMVVNSPFTSVSTLKPEIQTNQFMQWDMGQSTYQWWWELSSTFEGLSLQYHGSEEIRGHFSYVTRMKHPRDTKFLNFDSTLFNNSFSSTHQNIAMTLTGAQWQPQKDMKLQAWYAYLSHSLHSYYLQTDFTIRRGVHTFLLATQFLTQRDANGLQQNVESSLHGLRVSYRLNGLTAALNFTKTTEAHNGISAMLLPLGGAPAFTNSFVLRNTNTQFPQQVLNTDGPYGSGTRTSQLTLSYDMNYLKIYGLELYGLFSRYNKNAMLKSAVTLDLAMHYNPPGYGSWHLSSVYSKLNNADFTSLDQEWFRVQVGYHF